MLKRIVVFWVAWAFVVATGVLLALRPAHAMIELKRVSVTYRSYFPGGSDPYLTQNLFQPGKSLDKGLNLNMDTDVLQYLYWNTQVSSLSDHDPVNGGGQFRYVSLEMALGVDLRTLLDLPLTLGLRHYSGHTLDTPYPQHFPVDDAFELKVYIYERRPYVR